MDVRYQGSPQAEEFLSKTINNFKKTLGDSSKCSFINYKVDLLLNTSNGDLDLNINTDESYQLKIEFTGIIL